MSFDSAGFEVIENVLSVENTESLLAVLTKRQLKPLRGGIRRIEQLIPEVATLAQSSKLLDIARKHLAAKPRLVRAIYFDKSPDHNWFVTWHQDRTVAVSDRFEMTGWGPWSLKAGAWHVHPPIEVLEQMVTLRVHLDAATIANGCLKIALGSHRLGLIPSEQVTKQIDKSHVAYCEAAVGGVLIMRPHILHASEKSSVTTRRRVLHFEYSSFQLPEDITWAA